MPDRLNEIRARLDTRNMKWCKDKSRPSCWHTHDFAWEIVKGYMLPVWPTNAPERDRIVDVPANVWNVFRSHVGHVCTTSLLSEAKAWVSENDARYEAQLGGRRG